MNIASNCLTFLNMISENGEFTLLLTGLTHNGSQTNHIWTAVEFVNKVLLEHHLYFHNSTSCFCWATSELATNSCQIKNC